MSITSLEPQTVLLTAKKYYRVTVPVVTKTKGEPARGYQITNLTVTPEVLTLLVPESAEPPTEIITETIDLANQKESFVVPVKFILPPGTKPDKPENISANAAITIGKI